MYSSQTSLIPITVALTKYLEANGSGGLFDYWYLGSTPFKYLTGPVVPYLLVYLEKLIPVFSYFELSIVLIFVSFIIRAVGWGLFAGFLAGDKRTGWAVGIISLIMPWHIVSALGLAEVSTVVAGSLTPWLLLTFQRFLIDDSKFTKLFRPVMVFALLLLVNTTAATPAIIGLLIISISNYKLSITKLKSVLTVVLMGGVLTLWWYSPGYWLTIWGAPGIGGKNILGVLGTFLNFMRGLLPVVLAMLFVFWKVKPKTVFEKFGLGWLVLFGSMTLFRFMADWDFWMDWTAWGSEVEAGLALLFAKVIYDLRFKTHENIRLALFVNPKKLLTLTLIIISGWGLAWQNRGFWLPRVDISQTAEYKIAHWFEQESRNREKETGKISTVFLSGTTAFWLNSLVDIQQVRGGRDEASLDSKWREAVWEVREGQRGGVAVNILKSLGVDYLVVHSEASFEYYHDFKNPDKFAGRSDLEKMYDFAGDVIYKIK